MPTEIKYIPMRGGMDLVSSPLSIDDGRIIEGNNFEQIFGKNGYRRVDGYERYDGTVLPSESNYQVLPVRDVTGSFTLGDTVTGPTGSGKFVGQGTGYIALSEVTGTFAEDDVLSPAAVVDGAISVGNLGVENHYTYLKLAQADRRALIAKVPGSGPVLGLHVFQGVLYAARNAANGLSAAIYKATPTGWSLVKSGLIAGGSWRFVTANFTGDSARLAMYGCDGRNSPFKYDGTTWTTIGAIYGSQGSSVTSLAIGTGNKAFTVVETLRNWEAGQTVTAWDKDNAENSMTGVVVSYASDVLTVDVAAVTGSGTVANWLIGRTDYSDKPFDVTAHRSHLFLAYPQGQLQHSNLGDPMTYTSTAGSFGLGEEITGFTAIKGGNLAIFCRSRIEILYGSGTTTWSMQTHSMDAGAIRNTVVEVAGAALMIDDRGLVSLQSTQSYGNFESANISKPVKPLLDKYLLRIVGSKSHKGKNLCRIYFDDGTGINATMFEPSALIDPRYIAFTRFQYNHVPACVTRGEKSDGTEVHYFGTTDGWVMREDSGVNFDGDPISASFRMPFINLRSPANKKRFRKLVIEADAPRTMSLNFRQLMDYADDYYAAGVVHSGQMNAGGGAYDVNDWNTIIWSAPLVTQAETNIDGVGRNMSVLVWHEDDFTPAFTVQGMLLHYSVLGVAR